MKPPGGLRRNPFLVVEAILSAVRVEFLVRFRSADRVLLGASSRHSPARDWDDRSDTFLRAIAYAYRVLPFEPTCLKQAIVFCLYRRRRGLPAVLRIGVQKAGESFAAHAWVEDERGTALTDPQEGFSPLTLRPTRGARTTG